MFRREKAAMSESIKEAEFSGGVNEPCNPREYFPLNNLRLHTWDLKKILW